MIEYTQPVCEALRRNRLEITAKSKLLPVACEIVRFTSELIIFSQVITDPHISPSLLLSISDGD